MQHFKTSAFCALLCALSLACFDSDDIDLGSSESDTGLEFRASSGALWERCTEDPLEAGALLDGWGCDGKSGEGLACFMAEHPLNKHALSICVPQIADPNVVATCDGLPTPPTSGGIIPEKGLCLPSCSPGTCEPGYVCSTGGFCAIMW